MAYNTMNGMHLRIDSVTPFGVNIFLYHKQGFRYAPPPAYDLVRLSAFIADL